MYERMLNKIETPSLLEMTDYCGENAEFFTLLNDWLSQQFATKQEIVFPYGNQYGWCITHKSKKKLVCNIFAEKNSFSVMMRLSNKQFESVYENTSEYTQKYIDNKFPCSEGGWIHYRVTNKDHFKDIKKLLSMKCSLQV